jgi:hypothetical protein
VQWPAVISNNEIRMVQESRQAIQSCFTSQIEARSTKMSRKIPSDFHFVCGANYDNRAAMVLKQSSADFKKMDHWPALGHPPCPGSKHPEGGCAASKQSLRLGNGYFRWIQPALARDIVRAKHLGKGPVSFNRMSPRGKLWRQMGVKKCRSFSSITRADPKPTTGRHGHDGAS